MISWILEQLKNRPLDMIGILISLTTLAFVIRDFLRDRPDVRVQVEPSRSISGSNETVTGITISVRNKGKRRVLIKKIGILSPNEEKVFFEGLDWVLGEQESRWEYASISPPFIQSTSSLYEDIQSGKYIAFAEDDNGKRYWSRSTCEKFKILGRLWFLKEVLILSIMQF